MKVTYKDNEESRIEAALKVYDAIRDAAPADLEVTLRPYSNCREQGFNITAGIRSASFSENRNSDDIVVYLGNRSSFDADGLASEAVYRKAKYYRYDHAAQAAAAIVKHLTK